MRQESYEEQAQFFPPTKASRNSSGHPADGRQQLFVCVSSWQ
jgi:hypothetical protein